MDALELGDVVCRASGAHEHHPVLLRGVVMPASWKNGGADGAIKIHHGDGTSSVNPDPHHWTPVPREHQTAEERVRSACWSYLADESDGEPGRDWTEFAWSLMCALLTSNEHADVFPENGDWPTSYDELAAAIARALDFRDAAREMSFT